MRLPVLTVLAVLLTLPAMPAGAASPDAPEIDSDRYTLQETAEGWLRLDRESGTLSLCRAKESRWTCAPVPDAIASFEAEIGALEADKRRLEARVEELERQLQKAGRAPQGPPREPLLTPKDEREFDRFMDFSERALRRFFGMVKDLRRDFEDRI